MKKSTRARIVDLNLLYISILFCANEYVRRRKHTQKKTKLKEEMKLIVIFATDNFSVFWFRFTSAFVEKLNETAEETRFFKNEYRVFYLLLLLLLTFISLVCCSCIDRHNLLNVCWCDCVSFACLRLSTVVIVCFTSVSLFVCECFFFFFFSSILCCASWTHIYV